MAASPSAAAFAALTSLSSGLRCPHLSQQRLSRRAHLPQQQHSRRAHLPQQRPLLRSPPSAAAFAALTSLSSGLRALTSISGLCCALLPQQQLSRRSPPSAAAFARSSPSAAALAALTSISSGLHRANLRGRDRQPYNWLPVVHGAAQHVDSVVASKQRVAASRSTLLHLASKQHVAASCSMSLRLASKQRVSDSASAILSCGARNIPGKCSAMAGRG